MKPSTETVSFRLPLLLLEMIKIDANRRDAPYQSLIKIWLGEKPKLRDQEELNDAKVPAAAILAAQSCRKINIYG